LNFVIEVIPLRGGTELSPACGASNFKKPKDCQWIGLFKNSKIGERNQFFPLNILNVTWSTQNWLKWWLEKVRVVYIDGCFDEYCGKVRAGLQSNFLSPSYHLAQHINVPGKHMGQSGHRRILLRKKEL